LPIEITFVQPLLDGDRDISASKLYGLFDTASPYNIICSNLVPEEMRNESFILMKARIGGYRQQMKLFAQVLQKDDMPHKRDIFILGQKSFIQRLTFEFSGYDALNEIKFEKFLDLNNEVILFEEIEEDKNTFTPCVLQIENNQNNQ